MLSSCLVLLVLKRLRNSPARLDLVGVLLVLVVWLLAAIEHEVGTYLPKPETKINKHSERVDEGGWVVRQIEYE